VARSDCLNTVAHYIGDLSSAFRSGLNTSRDLLARRAKKTGDRVALSTHPQTAWLAIFCRALETTVKAIEARNGAARKGAVS